VDTPTLQSQALLDIVVVPADVFLQGLHHFRVAGVVIPVQALIEHTDTREQIVLMQLQLFHAVTVMLDALVAVGASLPARRAVFVGRRAQLGVVPVEDFALVIFEEAELEFLRTDQHGVIRPRRRV